MDIGVHLPHLAVLSASSQKLGNATMMSFGRTLAVLDTIKYAIFVNILGDSAVFSSSVVDEKVPDLRIE